MSTEPAGGTISGNTSPREGGDTNTITDRQLFDQAVSSPDPTPSSAPSQPSQTPSSTGEASAAPAMTRPDLQQQPVAPGAQPRAPDGKFAPKPQGQQGHHVPLAELMKERDARQRLEAHASELTRAVMALQQQMLPQQQPQQPQGPQTIYDDPEAYLEQRVVQPLRQEGQLYMMKIKDGLSREQANQQFGAREVNAALMDIQRIRQTPQGQFVFGQIMQSDHPYGQLVQWHRQARAQAAIGANPQAWLQQQQQAWAQNEKVQDYVASLRAKRLGAQQARPANQVQLPPSLSSVRSSSGRMDNGGDLSSASLYDFATK